MNRLLRLSPLVNASTRSTLLAAFLGALATFAHAGQTWTGGGATDNWSDANNWGGTPPDLSQTIIFAGVTRPTPFDDAAADTLVGGINFTNTNATGLTAAFTVSGNRFTLGGNIVTTATTTGTLGDTISNNILLSATPTITTNASHNLTLSGNIGDIGGGQGITKAGGGTLTLSGSNTYGGLTAVNAGVLAISSSGNLGNGSATNTIALNGGTLRLVTNIGAVDLGVNRSIALTGTNQVQVDTGSTLTVGGVISGTGILQPSSSTVGSGTLILTGANTFSGNITTAGNNPGAVQIGTINKIGDASSNLGTGSAITLGNGSATSSLIFANSPSAQTTDRTVTIGAGAGGGGGIIANNNTNPANTVTFTGTLTGAGSTNTTKTLTLSGSNTGDNTVQSTITDGTNSGNKLLVTKSGTGTWVLTGANTYTGATTISGGKLRITNTTGSGTGGGVVTLSGGVNATLSGSGTSTGLLTATNLSRLAPGVNTADADASGRGNFGAAGTLSLGTTGGMTLTSASFDFDLASTAAGVSDRIGTGGALSLGATQAFAFNELGGALETGVPYTLISGASSINAINPTNWTTTFYGGSTYAATYGASGNDLTVIFQAVPEPSTFVLLAVGLGLLIGFERSRRVA